MELCEAQGGHRGGAAPRPAGEREPSQRELRGRDGPVALLHRGVMTLRDLHSNMTCIIILYILYSYIMLYVNVILYIK